MKNTIILFAAVMIIAAGISVGVAEKQIKGVNVNYSTQGVDMVGYLAYDEKIAGKRPGVLVVHEWWGLNDYARMRAQMLAESGYTALAVDMYGGDKVERTVGRCT